MTPVLVDYARRQCVAVDLPPTSNNLFPTVNGRRVTSGTYARWQKVARWQLAPLRRPVVFPCRVEILIRAGADWRDGSDVANREKCILDSLVKLGVLPDDSSRFVAEVLIQFVKSSPEADRTQVLVTLASHA